MKFIFISFGKRKELSSVSKNLAYNTKFSGPMNTNNLNTTTTTTTNIFVIVTYVYVISSYSVSSKQNETPEKLYQNFRNECLYLYIYKHFTLA